MRSAKDRLVMFLRRRSFQPFWTGLHRRILIVMNFWSSDVHLTGEIDAVRLVGRSVDTGQRTAIAFDVGANIGDFSEICLANLPAGWLVHAFEPSPSTCRLMVGRIGDAPADRLRIHNLGFSDSEREATLYSPGVGATIASVHRLEHPQREFHDEYSETIQLRTIDAFCAAENIDFIDFLKLDIEGHELFALQGASRMLSEGRIRFLQFEFGENNIDSRTYLRDIVKLLGESYSISRIVPGGLTPWSYQGGLSEIFATTNYLCERRGVPPAPALNDGVKDRGATEQR